jgi:ADP-ribose pyrophosphatase YjhB (NUDIX family)
MRSPKRTSAKPKLSAGILAYRRGSRGLEVLLVHPGGPYWRNKDLGAWSIPKGEIGPSENPEQAARREFAEELGPAALISPLQALGEIRQRGGKRVIALAAVFRPSRKSIAPSGSTWKSLDRRSYRDRSNLSTGLKRRRGDAMGQTRKRLSLFARE